MGAVGDSFLPQIRVETRTGRHRSDQSVAKSGAARPWRLRGVPTPKSVRISNPRLSPPACTSSRLRMLS